MNTSFSAFVQWFSKNWKGVWLAIAVTGTLYSFTNELTWKTTAVWLTFSIAAIITIADGWDKFLEAFGNAGLKLLSSLLKTMTGGHGTPFALFLDGGIAFVGGFMVGGNNGTTLAAIGVLAILLAAGLAVNKTVSK